MGPGSSSHKVTFTPNRWLMRRSQKTVDRSLTRPEAGGFSSQTVSTSTSMTFSQGVFPQKMSAPQDALYAAAEVNHLVADDGNRQTWATIRSGMPQRVGRSRDCTDRPRLRSLQPSHHSQAPFFSNPPRHRSLFCAEWGIFTSHD